MKSSRALLGPGGPLVRHVPGFQPRPAQQDMAARIESALARPGVFIAESGTGTGKTYAYLVPALRSGKKVLISSGTKNLQDQLYRHDLPLVRAALQIPAAVALLKGRANYLCRYRLAQAEMEEGAASPTYNGELRRVREFAARTQTGDIAEADEVPEDAAVWPRVTSTADNCLGGRCPDFNNCYVNRARTQALAADIVVVNHHLFFADLQLRVEGFAQLLPGVEAIIFDEAHQLPEIATHFFGTALSSQQLYGLCRDVIAADLAEHSGVAELRTIVPTLEKEVADLRLSLGVEPRRDALEGLANFQVIVRGVQEALADLSGVLNAVAARGEGLAQCARRAAELLDRLELIGGDRSLDNVAWFETGARSFVLHLTPLNVAVPFREQLQATPTKTWIFTSATLAVGAEFSHFKAQLGLDEADSAQWHSPFDYQRQALLYIPEGLPDPSAREHTDQVVAAALPVLAASRGRAFMLFTSHRALKRAAALLPDRVSYPLLVQGSMPRQQLLECFRAAGNAVLLATASFWEGVDVRGDALSCVIIDKLPFASPDDPVLQARAQALEELGQNPFFEYQLPNAVIALKQGVGRLIRDVSDRGVLMLCDPRVFTRSYGKVFLASLPPMPRTRALADVERFFAIDASRLVNA